jgi:hypothetical protein
MSDAPRKQLRLSLPPDFAAIFHAAKQEAEKASGVALSDTQFALALIRKGLSV